MTTQGPCKCPHHRVPGLTISLIGLLFLLGAFGLVGERIVEIGWPILLIVAGGSKMMSHKCTCCMVKP